MQLHIVVMTKDTHELLWRGEVESSPVPRVGEQVLVENNVYGVLRVLYDYTQEIVYVVCRKRNDFIINGNGDKVPIE